jgi:hypothetical protein
MPKPKPQKGGRPMLAKGAAKRQIFDGTLHKAMRIILLERETYTALPIKSVKKPSF